jgi:orotidine-5'-phosphate decarboxylase
MNRDDLVTAAERLIVALDVPTVGDALQLVETLDNVAFFKIGWELFLTGETRALVERLGARRTFLDLKIPADIGNTIGAAVEQCVRMQVRLLTLSDSMPRSGIESAVRARGRSATPKFLVVPALSSMDSGDLRQTGGTVDDYIVARGSAALEAGCDGLIASGSAIRRCRERFPSALIVSPGIRPAGSTTDDHKRHTTPAEAIRLGADYLVVGRPILNAPSPREAAAAVIAEIREALAVTRTSASPA